MKTLQTNALTCVSTVVLAMLCASCDEKQTAGGSSAQSGRKSSSTATEPAARAEPQVAVQTLVDEKRQNIESAKAVEAVQAAADRKRAQDAGIESE